MITYIQLNDLGYLDVKDEVAVPLNFSIAEIQDISKRQGGFSKTIKLAGTSNNNNLLGHLFDVNIADASFNINIKQRCQIIQNGVSVFDGYLQLLNVNKISPSSGAPDEFVEYEVQVKDDSGNFYSSLQEKMLQDLPYWEQYNHIYTLSAITATSAHTVNDGYTYILPWKGITQYTITDFAPAIYAKAYWDRILLDAGYTYEWDSIEACGFDKLIVPYNGDTPLANTSNNFRAGFQTGTTIGFTTSGASNSLMVSINQIKFDDVTTQPNFTDGNYNTVTGQYKSTFYGSVELQTKYKYTIELVVPVNCKFNASNSNGILSVALVNGFQNLRSGVPNSNNNELFDDVLIYDVPAFSSLTVTSGTYLIKTGTSPKMNFLADVIPNDEMQLFLFTELTTLGFWFQSDGVTPLPLANIPSVKVSLRIDPEDYESNFLIGNPTNSLNEGQIVDVKDFIPKQIKQKDFINGIVKMFNLYITPDKYEDNHLIIQTRDDYYDSGSIVDWTDKFAVDNEAQIEFLPDLQDKRLILSYKQDNDEWNKQYQLATAEVYGQVQYQFENEFTQSTKKIENIFSPTPIIPNTNGLLVPAIVNKNPKTNIRILYYDGWKDGSWDYRFLASVNFVTFDKYPRALHLDDPINPTIDINYAQPDYFGYSTYQTVTDNNLYNRFWSRFINQIETGKLLKGTFLLDENDIHNLDLRSKVWLHDCYWNINRIIDYNPNGNGLTKVELISVDEGLKFAPYNIERNNTGNTVTDVGVKNNWITNFVSVQDGQSKNEYGTTVVNTPVFGQDNIIQSRTQSSLILGNGNRISTSDSIVIGENNDVQGSNMFAFGNNISFTGDSQAIFNVPVSATTISATTLYVNGSEQPIEPSVWTEGSAGNFSIKAINDSTTDATGNYAVAEGQDTLASGDASHAEGGGTIASGLGAHAEGSLTTASGNFGSHAEGDGTLASGPSSHAEGVQTIASAGNSHAEGNLTTASGINSHAQGLQTLASGNNSHAEGNGSQALGAACHAQGINTIAEGFASHAGGNESRTNIDGEFASSFTSIGAPGQSQYGIIDGATSTANAAPTLLDFATNNTAVNGWRPSIAGSGLSIAVAFRYQIVCFESAANNARIITGEGLIKWNAGTPTLSFASTPSVNGDLALLGVTATPVASGNGLQFQVTGLAATFLRWHVRVDYSF